MTCIPRFAQHGLVLARGPPGESWWQVGIQRPLRRGGRTGTEELQLAKSALPPCRSPWEAAQWEPYAAAQASLNRNLLSTAKAGQEDPASAEPAPCPRLPLQAGRTALSSLASAA